MILDYHIQVSEATTDMYIPTNNPDEKVYCYDVNSLYPYIMASITMPVGHPTYFEGNIRKFDPEAYGFFYCKVTTPKYLEHPLLQIHCKTKSGYRTVSPLGQFEAMIHSSEMDKYIKHGYHFDIIWGYRFEQDYVFKDFIRDLYMYRLKYSKTDPLNYINKIIMNSLYGRFGMDDNFTNSIIVDKDSYLKYENESFDNIIDITPLKHKYLLEVKSDNTSTMLDNGRETHKVNVAIASTITANARIYMSQFKNHPDLKLFYSDTDSIYTNLNPEQMNELFQGIVSSTRLGKLKLESVCDKAIFLGPKLYYLHTVVGNSIFKVKGLDKNVPLTEQDFQDLLTKGHIIQEYQEKWFRSIENSKI